MLKLSFLKMCKKWLSTNILFLLCMYIDGVYQTSYVIVIGIRFLEPGLRDLGCVFLLLNCDEQKSHQIFAFGANWPYCSIRYWSPLWMCLGVFRVFRSWLRSIIVTFSVYGRSRINVMNDRLCFSVSSSKFGERNFVYQPPRLITWYSPYQLHPRATLCCIHHRNKHTRALNTTSISIPFVKDKISK